MRAFPTVLALLVLVAGCTSEDKPPETARPRPSPAPAAAPSPAPSGGIVIKGTKRTDPSPEPAATDEQAKREARIAELSRRAAQGTDTTGWKDFQAPDGSFRILFPRAPEKNDSAGRAGDGTALTEHRYSVNDANPERRYVATSVDHARPLPPERLDAFFAAVVPLTPNALKGHGIETKPISVEGAPGRETRFDFADGKSVGRERIVVVGARSYQLTVYGTKEGLDERDFDRFLDSFKLLKRGDAPPPKPAAAVWAEFTAPDGTFSAWFPAPPTASEPDGMPKADGTPTKVKRFLVTDRAGVRLFAVTCIDLDRTPTTREEAFPNVRPYLQAPGTAAQGKASESRDVAVSGALLGREVAYELADGRSERDRIALAGARIYQVIALGPKDEASAADAQRFLDSFKILR